LTVRRIAVTVAVIVTVAVAGAVLARVGDDGDSATGAAAPSDSVDPSTGSEVSDAAATVDVDAARMAAIQGVARTGEVAQAGFISRRELIESFTTPQFASTLARTTSDAVNAMLLELGERDADVASFAVVERPITAIAVPTGVGVEVRVWSVLVVAVRGVGPGRQVWRTVTLQMVEVDGRWLVDGWSSTPGPSPAPPAEGAFDDAEAFVEPLSWPPADGRPASGGQG
jgi:hypothetical protein